MKIDDGLISPPQRRIVLWKCSPSSETRGRRKDHENGCAWWNRMTTKKPFPMQMTPCEKCANRSRKDEGGIYEQVSLSEAQREQDRRNSDWEGL